jgi:hypothetical protein
MQAEALHYWILVLDMESFSPRKNPVQRAVRGAMYEVVEEAFARAGIGAEAQIVMEDRGDGILILVPPTVSPVLLAGEFVRELHEGLKEKAVLTSAAAAMRLRVALHQGLATRDEHGWSGDAVNTTFRLSEAAPLRDVLAAAHMAHLVFAVSGEVYTAVVQHGYRPIDPAAYLPMPFRTKHGEPVEAWVTVPGYSAPPGLPPQQPELAPAAGGTATPAPPAQAARTTTNSNNTLHGDLVAGDKTVHVTGPYPGLR